MKQFKIIDQLQLVDGVLMCKKPSGRSFQRAHYRQGDLDGACGAYSISMVLNILGVFHADEINSNSDKADNRFAERRLIKALNEQGLYRDGLNSNDIQAILSKNYSKYVNVNSFTKNEYNILKLIVDNLNDNTPVVLGIRFNKENGHWVVVVGYEIDAQGEIKALLTLDPGANSPTYSYWNGIINLKKAHRKTYGYLYTTDNSTMIDFDEIIIVNKK